MDNKEIVKREGQIQIIGLYELVSDGYKVLKWILPLLPVLAIFCLVILVKAESAEDVIIGSLCFLFFTVMSVLLVYKSVHKSVYVPGKTFPKYRSGNDTLKKRYMLVMGILALLFIVSAVLYFGFDADGVKQLVWLSLAGIGILWYMLKSMRVHEDIDFATNQELEEIMGMDIDERVLGSYQNFDSSETEREKNDNLIVVTNRKIFYAKYTGKQWVSLTRRMSEITAIGILATGQQEEDLFMKLKFADHTSLGLKMELMDKLTSNPVLFVRCFLNALDSSILGESVVTSRRRRITTDASQPHAESAQEDTAGFRKIDLSPSDLSGLSASEKYAPGRQIEL